MLSHIPGTEARDAVDPRDIEDVHEKIQVRMLGDVAKHALGCEDVFVVNVFCHSKIPLIVNSVRTSATVAPAHRVDALSRSGRALRAGRRLIRREYFALAGRDKRRMPGLPAPLDRLLRAGSASVLSRDLHKSPVNACDKPRDSPVDRQPAAGYRHQRYSSVRAYYASPRCLPPS